MMERGFSFRKPTAEDISYVVEHMREADRKELKRQTGLDTLWNLQHSVDMSARCWTAVSSRGVPFGIFGACWSNILEAEAILWALSTDECSKRPIEFCAMSKAALDLVCKELPGVCDFVNWVDVEYKAAMRWIEWFGGTFSIQRRIPGRCGSSFALFYFTNPYFKEEN